MVEFDKEDYVLAIHPATQSFWVVHKQNLLVYERLCAMVVIDGFNEDSKGMYQMLYPSLNFSLLGDALTVWESCCRPLSNTAYNLLEISKIYGKAR